MNSENEPVLWSDLQCDDGLLKALDYAGPRIQDWGQNEKRRWSERFANGCAIAIAEMFRRSDHAKISSKLVRPVSIETGTEPLTPLGSGTSKRIDVTVSDSVLGLEIGVSLKGLNFRDSRSGNFDKNLTGRLYELGDEVRLVHEHLPHAFMVGVFFLPLESATDKTEIAKSSFANSVLKLRERTGRLDAAVVGHAARCDASFVALYTIGDEPEGYPAGLVRFFDVNQAPPRRGRPKISSTLSMVDMVDYVVALATKEASTDWAEPESE